MGGAGQGMGGRGMRGMGRMGGMGFGRGGSGRTMTTEARSEDKAIEMTAIYYSVSSQAVVARLRMRYLGTDFDDAVSKFADKLRTVVPAATCSGWR